MRAILIALNILVTEIKRGQKRIEQAGRHFQSNPFFEYSLIIFQQNVIRTNLEDETSLSFGLFQAEKFLWQVTIFQEFLTLIKNRPISQKMRLNWVFLMPLTPFSLHSFLKVPSTSSSKHNVQSLSDESNLGKVFLW